MALDPLQVDACSINDLNALVLGSGLLTVTEASEKLFLMTDEVRQLPDIDTVSR